MLDLVERPDNRFIIDALNGFSRIMGVYVQFPDLTKLHLEKLAQLIPGAGLMREKYNNFTENFVSSVLESRDPSQSFFSRIINSTDEKVQRSFPEPELWAEGVFLMLAGEAYSHSTVPTRSSSLTTSKGSDTTSIVLSSLSFYLSRFPDKYNRLVQEIRRKFPSKESIRAGPALQSCTYLHACIDEAMRMSPPTPGSPWREVERGGAVIAGEYVPHGYDVGCCIYAVHHNEAYFPDSFTFSPERWLPDEPIYSQGHSKLAAKAFKPFSIGPRSCAGRAMAMLELNLTMAKLLWSLDFRRAEDGSGDLGGGKPGSTNGRHRVNEYQLRTHITSSGIGPRLQFRPRII